MNQEKQYLKKIKITKRLKILENDCRGLRVLIYGAGKLFTTFLEEYTLSNFNIVGICDKKFSENSESFMGYKTFSPQDIPNIEFDCLLIALKDCGSIITQFKEEFPQKTVLPFFMNEQNNAYKFNILKTRNFQRNLDIILFNNFKICNSMFYDEYKAFLLLKQKLGYLLTKKIEIPQIEFNLTTKCTLRCKHCLNFIPQIKPDEHVLISIDEFKSQLKNLTSATRRIRRLVLIGGEPLLVKDLEKYIEVAAKNKKVESVWIYTNGTLLVNDNILKISNKYKQKVVFYISNYSKNKAISKRFKYEQNFELLKSYNITHYFDEALDWEYCSPLPNKKQRENSLHYFKSCTNPCVSVFGGKIFVCPRAGTFVIKGIYTPSEKDYIDLNKETNPKILAEKLIRFYSNDYFQACDYCTVLEDKQKPLVTPALQIEN